MKRIDLEAPPTMCIWCNFAGLFLNTKDNLEAIVCLHPDNRKGFKKGRPANREYRWFLKVMDSMERCEHFSGVRVRDRTKRTEMLEYLGLLNQSGVGVMDRKWHVEHADGSEWTIDDLEDWMLDHHTEDLLCCDVQGFYIDEYGNLVILDGCGNWRYAPDSDDMRVVWDG